MNIFFDVDYTLISYEGALRPHVKEVFQALKDEGHDIYIWSGVGLRDHEVRSNALDEFVSGIFVKPLYDHWAQLPKLGVTARPDFVVDDHSEVVAAFGGAHITPYSYPSGTDSEMLRIHEMIRRAAAVSTGDKSSRD